MNKLIGFVTRLIAGLVAVYRYTCRPLPEDFDAKIFLDITQTIRHRTLRELLILFNQSDYGICLRAHWNKQTFSFAPELAWHAGAKYVWRAHAAEVYGSDCADALTKQRPACQGKQVMVHYDLAPDLAMPPGHFAMPFPMHPQMYVQHCEAHWLEPYRRAPRRVRGMFSGNRQGEGYGIRRDSKVGTLLCRREIVLALQQDPNTRVVSDAAEWTALLEQPFTNSFILFGPDARVHQANWLDAISQADFFLCPPGIVHAWSHNLVEAMAVGTIPITNYPEWWYPHLQNGVNCLTFQQLDDLGELLYDIRHMSPYSIHSLRTNAAAYYDQWLEPQRFVRRMLDAPQETVHLHVWRT